MPPSPHKRHPHSPHRRAPGRQVDISGLHIDYGTLLTQRKVSLKGPPPRGTTSITLTAADLGAFTQHPLFLRAAATAVEVRAWAPGRGFVGGRGEPWQGAASPAVPWLRRDAGCQAAGSGRALPGAHASPAPPICSGQGLFL